MDQPMSPYELTTQEDYEEHLMRKFLTDMGCKKRGDYYILDGFDVDFYLLFDASEGGKPGTVDIHVADIGACPRESDLRNRIMDDVNEMGIKRLMFALGISRFPEKTQAFLCSVTSVIRNQ